MLAVPCSREPVGTSMVTSIDGSPLNEVHLPPPRLFHGQVAGGEVDLGFLGGVYVFLLGRIGGPDLDHGVGPVQGDDLDVADEHVDGDGDRLRRFELGHDYLLCDFMTCVIS